MLQLLSSSMKTKQKPKNFSISSSINGYNFWSKHWAEKEIILHKEALKKPLKFPGSFKTQKKLIKKLSMAGMKRDILYMSG